MTDRPNESRPSTSAPQPAHDPPPRRRGYERESIGEAMAKSFVRAIAGRLGRALARIITGRMR